MFQTHQQVELNYAIQMITGYLIIIMIRKITGFGILMFVFISFLLDNFLCKMLIDIDL